MWVLALAASAIIGSNVRSTDARLTKVIADGVRHSPLIRRLTDVIDASDVIVYVERGECPSPATSCVLIGPRAGGVRFLRIRFTIDHGLGKRAWHRDELSVMLAHELQHAAEIAQWRDVVDDATLMGAYTRRGLVLSESRLETHAARRAADERRAELRGRRRR